MQVAGVNQVEVLLAQSEADRSDRVSPNAVSSLPPAPGYLPTTLVWRDDDGDY